jgi:Protein of Unknown function (DUF2784)
MIYRMLADGLLVIHGAYLAFLVLGGFLAWRWRWVLWAHLIAVAWAVPLVVTDAFPCPFTESEKWLQEQGGEEPYDGGYIEHYLDGRLWPEDYTWVVEIACFSLVVISYVGLAVRWRRSKRRTSEAVTG